MMEYYVIKNNITCEYYEKDGFGTFSPKRAYEFKTKEEACERLEDILYYSRYEKGEISVYKITINTEEVL